MSNETTTEQLDQVEALDNATFSKFHLKMVFTAGMGFFTDAYDLFIIGVVTAILAPIWGLNIHQLALLNAAALASAAFGAVFFGTLSDKLGRKKMYGFEILILFFGAIMGACSTSFTMLLIARIIVGFGIGGDYPTSAVVASEAASKKNRGFMVLLVFAMQALGLTLGPLLASAFLASHIPAAYVWRILLGLGAIPAASVFFLRRRIRESPRYLLTKQTPVEVGRVVSDLAGFKDSVQKARYKKETLLNKKWLKYLVGTAGAWFLMDVAFYGNGVSSVLILKAISPHASLLNHTLTTALIFMVFAVPGYVMAAKYIDKIGRKTVQMLGFAMMAVCFALIAVFPAFRDILPMFIALYGMSFFFTNFGPNSTTFLIPSEIYPTSIRARAHGLSAAIGKVGAFVGAFFLPSVLEAHGIGFTIGLMSIVSLGGILVTLFVPEMKNKSLQDAETVVRLVQDEA
jgi:MFS transporter, PHS family, inorganic phosphate transporter